VHRVLARGGLLIDEGQLSAFRIDAEGADLVGIAMDALQEQAAAIQRQKGRVIDNGGRCASRREQAKPVGHVIALELRVLDAPGTPLFPWNENDALSALLLVNATGH
jgi:hypothetical protein